MRKTISIILVIMLVVSCFAGITVGAIAESSANSDAPQENEQDTVLFDFNNEGIITAVRLIPNSEITKTAKYSGEWNLSERSAITFKGSITDFTPYTEIRFWVYGNSETPATFMFRLLSENDETDGDDYYGQQITIKKDGWQEVVLPFTNLSVTRTPRGLDQIDAVQFISTGWGMQNDPEAKLYIDSIYLGNRAPKPTPTADPNDWSRIEDAICLMLESPYSLVNNQRKQIDERNKKVVPFTTNGRTMVPVRFIGEALGASVSYTGGDVETVKIKLGSDTIELVIGSDQMIKNGAAQTIDAPAMTTSDDRTFVPLRACAEAFGKEVFWDDMGFIVIYDKKDDKKDLFNRDTDLSLMLNIISSLTFDRPSGKQMMDDLKSVTKSAHPRLLATQQDFDRILENAKSDEMLADWIKKSISKADTLLNSPLPVYKIGSRATLENVNSPNIITTLSAAYKFTGDTKYAERVWKEMEALTKFPDWHPGHFLDTSALMQAMAIGYDWTYDYLTPQQRKTIEQGMNKHGIYAAKTAYEGTTEGMEPRHGILARSGWVHTTNNWNTVCNAGVTWMAIVLADVYESECVNLFENLIKSVERGVRDYAPDGGHPEGPSYWNYGTTHLVKLMAALEKAMGTTYRIFNFPGLSQTAYYTSYIESSQGMWNYHDSGEGFIGTESLFWFANMLNDPDLAGLRMQRIKTGQQAPTLFDILWYDPNNINMEVHLPLDKKYDGIDTVTMRSDWNDSGAVFTGLHAGSNSVNHCNLDMGNFIIDAAGERWIWDLGTENYSLPGFFTYSPGGQRWNYYRTRAEGQNTLVIDPDGSDDQIVNARSKITTMQSKPRGAFAVADLSPGYGDKVKQMQRGVWLTDNRRAVVVQDEITLSYATEVWWFAHTKAKINVSADGKSAILERNGKRMHVAIVSPMSQAKFTVMDAEPLPISPTPNPSEYGRSEYKKLAIHVTDVTDYKLAVVFKTLDIGQNQPAFTYNFTPISDWSIPDGEIVIPRLKDLTVDGQTVKGFNPLSTSYKVVLPYGTTAVPEIGAEADGNYNVDITQPKSLPGIAAVTLTDPSDPSIYNTYVVEVRAAKEIEIEASAYQEGNPPEHAMDGDLSTRWSAEGEQHLTFIFNTPRQISSVWIAFWQASEKRKSSIEIQVSDNGLEFRTVFSGQSTGSKEELEEFKIEPVTAKAVRIIGRGNTVNNWNSILEVDFT